MVWKGCSVSHDFVPCGPSNVELPSLVQSMAKVSFPASIVFILFRTSALSPMSNGADDSDFMVAMLPGAWSIRPSPPYSFCSFSYSSPVAVASSSVAAVVFAANSTGPYLNAI